MSDNLKQQFRVVWKREGSSQRVRVYSSLKKAERFMQIFGSEPWKAYGIENPDTYICCNGQECGCGGQIWRDKLTPPESMPELKSVKLQSRTVGEWKAREALKGGL